MVSGSLRATDSLLSITAQFQILNIPTASNGTTFGPGTNGHVLISNGTSVYWGTTTAITQVGTITSGTWNGTTIAIANGGTGATTAENATWNLLHVANPGDLNTAKRMGNFKISNTTTNTPVSSMWGATWNIVDDAAAGNNGTSGSTWQLVFQSGSTNAWLRCITNTGNWTAYAKLVTSGNYTDYTVTQTGGGASGTWGISITGKSAGILNRTNLTKGTNPSSTQWLSSWFNFQTGTGTATTDRVGGGIESSIDTSGSSVLYLRAYKYASGADTNNYLCIICAKDGTCTYSVANAANFRSAISAPSTTGDGASGSWGISITGSSASCTGNAATATALSNVASDQSASNVAGALQAFWNAKKSTMPRNQLISFTSSHSGRAMHMGYFISGYDSSPYGGFFTAFYNTPYYSCSSNGTFSCYELVRNDSRTYSINVSGSSASCTGNAATATTASSVAWTNVSGRPTIDKTTVIYQISRGSNFDPIQSGYFAGMSTSTGISSDWWHILSMDWSGNDANNWISQLALPTASNKGVYYRTRHSSTTNSWYKLVTENDDIIISHATTATMTAASTNPKITFAESGAQPVYLIYTDYDSYRAPAGLKVVGNGNTTGNNVGSPAWFEVEGHIYASAVHNAIWNDYAECRKAAIEEPGYVIAPSINGVAHKTTKRLEPGCRIISDTWGHIIGESTEAKTPVAVSGRVLAYPYRHISEYTIGDCICSAPNGTVDIMTREEIKEYPDRIIGIVNEIPTYEVWEQTEPDGEHRTTRIEVKGRIWIDIK